MKKVPLKRNPRDAYSFPCFKRNGVYGDDSKRKEKEKKKKTSLESNKIYTSSRILQETDGGEKLPGLV